MKYLILLTVLLSFLACRENASDSKGKTAAPLNRDFTTQDALDAANKKFKDYLPKILLEHEAALKTQRSYTGEFTGDGLEDVAIYFTLSPEDKGDAMIGQGLSLYQNTGTDVNVIAGFEPDYLFKVNKISDGKIFVEKQQYDDNDARCCPSIRLEHALTISGSTVY
jgi:hypothetical protein